MDYSPPGSAVHGIYQARILDWLVKQSFRSAISKPEIDPMSLMSPTLPGEFFTTNTTWGAPNSRGVNLKE